MKRFKHGVDILIGAIVCLVIGLYFRSFWFGCLFLVASFLMIILWGIGLYLRSVFTEDGDLQIEIDTEKKWEGYQSSESERRFRHKRENRK